MIQRPHYLKQLISFQDTQTIKIVTGIRRCGKSTLLLLMCEHLLSSGVRPENIQYINFDDLDNEELTDYKKLHEHVTGRLCGGMNYIFLDEIQEVPQFQKTLASLQLRDNVDLYVTGSNAWLLSGELATLLSGRYVEIRMQPLSFREYVSAFPDKGDLTRKFASYLTESSFPGALEMSTRGKTREYLDGLYHSILIKDIASRLKIGDVASLDRLTRFLYGNIGSITSTRKIADTMTSVGQSISPHTVERYIQSLTDSFIICACPRWDVRRRARLKTGCKYFGADTGLRYYLLGGRSADRGHMLENIVYLELLRRKERVFTGKVGDSEIDFVTESADGVEYFQVSLSVRDETVLERELRPLSAVKDHNPKYLLTLDDDPPADWDGIKQVNIISWLLK